MEEEVFKRCASGKSGTASGRKKSTSTLVFLNTSEHICFLSLSAHLISMASRLPATLQVFEKHCVCVPNRVQGL
jgi:hypothetical protein